MNILSKAYLQGGRQPGEPVSGHLSSALAIPAPTPNILTAGYAVYKQDIPPSSFSKADIHATADPLTGDAPVTAVPEASVLSVPLPAVDTTVVPALCNMVVQAENLYAALGLILGKLAGEDMRELSAATDLKALADMPLERYKPVMAEMAAAPVAVPQDPIASIPQQSAPAISVPAPMKVAIEQVDQVVAKLADHYRPRLQQAIAPIVANAASPVDMDASVGERNLGRRATDQLGVPLRRATDRSNTPIPPAHTANNYLVFSDFGVEIPIVQPYVWPSGEQPEELSTAAPEGADIPKTDLLAAWHNCGGNHNQLALEL